MHPTGFGRKQLRANLKNGSPNRFSPLLTRACSIACFRTENSALNAIRVCALPVLFLSAPIFAIGFVAATPERIAKEVRYENIPVHFATNDSQKATDSLQTTEKKGTAIEAGSSSEGERHVYLSDVICRIEAAKRYPRRKQAPGIEDRVTVKLRIQADGSVKECSLTGTSSYDGFNSEALASIRRGRRNNDHMCVCIIFHLRGYRPIAC